jgi:DnaJ-domain-containing protein 1
MSVDERRRRLNRRLEEVLGREEAETLREDISGRGVSRDELRTELQEQLRSFPTRVEFEAKVSVLGSDLRREMQEIKADLFQQMNDQTKTLYRTIVVSNSALVFAVAGLAFGAARLA